MPNTLLEVAELLSAQQDTGWLHHRLRLNKSIVMRHNGDLHFNPLLTLGA